MSEERKYSRYRVEQLAKELSGKWHHSIVTNSTNEHKRIVIEYEHQRKSKDL